MAIQKLLTMLLEKSHKRLTRAPRDLVKSHERGNTRLNDKFSEWLNISPNSLKFVLDNKKNKKFWEKQVNISGHSTE